MTQEISSPKNESMQRADLTMEDWVQKTCLISTVTSGPTEHRTFQEAWHCDNEKERNNWRTAIRKEMRSMVDNEVWRKTERKKIHINRSLIGNKWVFKIRRDKTYKARSVALGYSQIPGVDHTTETEYMALSEGVKELKFIVQLLQTMNIEVELPIAVYVDNVGAIWLSNSRTTSDRTKHIDIRPLL